MKLVIKPVSYDYYNEYYILPDSENEESKLDKIEIGGLICVNDMLLRFGGKDKYYSEMYRVEQVGQAVEVDDFKELS